MRLPPAPFMKTQVALCIAFDYRLYVIQDLCFGLAVKKISNSAEGNANGSKVRTVCEIIPRHERLAFGNIAGNMKLLRICLFSAFMELSCCCCTSTLWIDGRAGGAFHTTFVRVLSSRSLVLWHSYIGFACFYRMMTTIYDYLGIGCSGSWNNLCSMAVFLRRVFAYFLIRSSPTAQMNIGPNTRSLE